MPVYAFGHTSPVGKLYLGLNEVEHAHWGGDAAFYNRGTPPTISAFTATPDAFTAPSAPPAIALAWTVTGEDSLTLKEVVPYFQDDADGFVTPLTVPFESGGNDGGAELTAAASGAPYGDHYGYLRAGVGGLAARRGMIADESTSKVLALAGHRTTQNRPDNIHISWTGMPTSGQVYGRWVPTTGAAVDFTMSIRNEAAAWTQWAPGISFPPGTPFYEAHAANVAFAGIYNASSGLPRGRFYLYSDPERTRQINLRTVPIDHAAGVSRTPATNPLWTTIRGYGYVLTAQNATGKAVARVNVQRRRAPRISYFRMRAGSFRRNAFNNNHRWIIAEFEVDGYPRPSLSLTYAPGNRYAHPLRLTAADPRRRTVYDESAANPDLGVGDEQISILLGSGTAMYRLTATNVAGSVHSDFNYDWPV